MTQDLLEYIYDTTVEGDMYGVGLTRAEVDEITKFIVGTFAISGEPFEITYRRMEAVCNSLPRELFIYGSELQSQEVALLDRLKDVYLKAAEELYPNRKEYFINSMLLSISTLNTGTTYKDITDESLANMTPEDAESTTSVVRVITSVRIECLESFEKFVLSSISEDMILLDTHSDNYIRSELIDLITDGYIDEITLRFDAETCKLKVFLGEQEISCYVLGEFYTRYMKNVTKCRNEYALLDNFPKNILLQGIDYDEVYDYLVSTGEFDDLKELDDGEKDILLEPKSLAFVMKGTAVLKKPFGIIFERVSTSTVSQNKEYLIPTMFNIEGSIDDIGINFTTENTILPAPPKISSNLIKDSKGTIYCINPSIIKSLLKKKPKVLTNVQVPGLSLADIDGVTVPKVIATDSNSTLLERIMLS